MFNIKTYLEKFRGLGLPEKKLKEIVVLSIKEAVGVSLGVGDVSVRNGELILKTSPAVKNAVFIKKDQILRLIKEKTTQPISDIR